MQSVARDYRLLADFRDFDFSTLQIPFLPITLLQVAGKDLGLAAPIE